MPGTVPHGPGRGRGQDHRTDSWRRRLRHEAVQPGRGNRTYPRRLRRSSTGPVPAARISFADIELDDDTHQVWKAGAEVALSPTEFNLLRYFMQNAGKVLSKAQILDHVWSYDFGGDANVVESYVSYLRRKIDTTEPRLLHTLRGVGYTLRLPRP